MKRTISWWAGQLASVAVLVVSGCGGGDAASVQAPTGIGPAGGTYSPGGGITLQVPAGALGQYVQISGAATRTDAQPVSGYTPLSTLYQFGPDGTVFAGPGATLTVPLPPGAPTDATILSTRLGDASSYEDLHATVAGGSISVTVHHFSSFFVAAAVNAPKNLAYLTNPAVYTVGLAIPANVPSSSGGVVASYSVAPALPAGLVLDAITGRITGTPTSTSATATYVVTASNSAGSTTASLTITVNAAVVAPSNLAYSANPAFYTAGTPIPANVPSSSGGAVTSYSVTPALPAGLSLDSVTGRITGTPTSTSATATYVVTASNSAGSTTASLGITVNAAAVAPSNLAYSTNPAVYTVGVAIPANVPSSSGGAVTSYSVTPVLPTGVTLDTITGRITGTPTSTSAAATYVVTAGNPAGSTTASLTITVNAAVVAPSNLAYSTNPAIYTVGTPIPANVPSASGGAVTSYSVTPALPTGLTLDTSTGRITGTPTSTSTATPHVVTASNSAGSTTASLTITVNAAVVAPSNLAYSANPAVYTVGVAIPANVPSHGGGAVTSYSVTPALPSGLSLDAVTGRITGTPTATSATATYVVAASNSAGSATANLTITVNAAVVAPSNLAYSTNPATYTVGVAIPANVPSSNGGTVTSYSVTPALPAGLTLDTITGRITGTPASTSATATHVVTASNSAGSTTVSLAITVNAAVVAPSNLAYSTNPAVYTEGVSISPNVPSSSGGAVTSYSVTPALPAGLTLDAVTGRITGVPTATSTATTYVVTASNSAGSTTANLTITVNAPVLAPSNLVYSTNPAVYTVGTAIPPNVPTNGGGAATSFAVAPPLPAGLTLDTSTGRITGVPTSTSAAATYVVTARNSAGSTTASLTITVNAAVVAPSNLAYSANPASYTEGLPIPANVPSSSGGAVTSYSVAPALPAGLALDTNTGRITGTPTSTSAATVYLVTASNSAGSTTVSLTITVNAALVMYKVFAPYTSNTVNVPAMYAILTAPVAINVATTSTYTSPNGNSGPTTVTTAGTGSVQLFQASGGQSYVGYAPIICRVGSAWIPKTYHSSVVIPTALSPGQTATGVNATTYTWDFVLTATGDVTATSNFGYELHYAIPNATPAYSTDGSQSERHTLSISLANGGGSYSINASSTLVTVNQYPGVTLTDTSTQVSTTVPDPTNWAAQAAVPPNLSATMTLCGPASTNNFGGCQPPLVQAVGPTVPPECN